MLNLKLGDILIKMRVPESVRIADAETVPIVFDVGSIHLFDADSGLRMEGARTEPASERTTPARAPVTDE